MTGGVDTTEALQGRIIELMDELRQSHAELALIRSAAEDADAVVEEERLRHRIAYHRLLEHNAELRSRIISQERRLRKLQRDVELLRANNAAMQRKLAAIKRILPPPLRSKAVRAGRRVAGQDENA